MTADHRQATVTLEVASTIHLALVEQIIHVQADEGRIYQHMHVHDMYMTLYLMNSLQYYSIHNFNTQKEE